MGFHPAWKYREVHQLEFNQGRLVSEKDISSRLRKQELK